MTLHRGDPVMFRGERHIVKEPHARVGSPDGIDLVLIEDDEGFAFAVGPSLLTPIGYTATVDSDGWVRSIEDEVAS